MKFTLLSVLILVLVVPFAFADSNSIIVNTDKTSYSEGETIVISGNVSVVTDSNPILIQIIHEGAIIEIAQIIVAQDGSFTKTVLAEKPAWKEAGEYIVSAMYEDATAETIFSYVIQFSNSTQIIPVNITSTDPILDDQPVIDEELITNKIPEWVKGVFVYWADGEISDDDLINAIKFLVETGIIVLE